MNQKQTLLSFSAKILLPLVLLTILSASIFAKKTEEDEKKERSSKTYTEVKVYPDIFKKAMHVVAKGNNEKELEFLVFDMDGKMVLSYKLKTGERKMITGLQKGNYMYHVFCGDEYLESGKIQFR
jgi:hypothetical protein